MPCLGFLGFIILFTSFIKQLCYGLNSLNQGIIMIIVEVYIKPVVCGL